MRRLCWLTLAAALVLLAPVSALAGTYEGDDALMKGAQALQFRIDSYFTLKDFRGSTISYQRFLKDRFALRLGLTLRGDHLSTEESFEAYDEDADEWVEGSADLTEWTHSYALAAEFLWYSGGAPVSVYYGGGLRASYSNRRDEYAFYHAGPDGFGIAFRRTTESSWGVGLTGTLGVQWLVTSFIALHAEYVASFMYESGKRDQEYFETFSDDKTYEHREWSSPEFKSHGVLFGLSVYF